MIDLPQKHYFKEVYNTIFIREKSSQISSIIIKISSFSHWNSCRSSVNFTIYHVRNSSPVATSALQILAGLERKEEARVLTLEGGKGQQRCQGGSFTKGLPAPAPPSRE
jgi:hypothetical protein